VSNPSGDESISRGDSFITDLFARAEEEIIPAHPDYSPDEGRERFLTQMGNSQPTTRGSHPAPDGHQNEDDGWAPGGYFSPEGIKGRWASASPRADGFSGYEADEYASGAYDLPEDANEDRPERDRRKRRDRGKDIWPDDRISDKDYWASVVADRPLAYSRGEAGDTAGAAAAAGRTSASEETSPGRQSLQVTLYTTTWCGFCKNLKRQLVRAGVEFAEVDIEGDPAAAEFVETVNGGNQTVPTVLFPDGSTMVNPSAAQVLARLAELAAVG
jgi:mycoredoxin